MRRSQRNRRRGITESVSALQIAGAVVALAFVVGGIGWLYVNAVSNHVELNQSDLCPKSGATAQALVLLDATDPLSDLTQTEVLNKLSDLVHASAVGEKIDVRVLAPNEFQTKIVKVLCNPGDGSNLDHWTGNPELAKRQWERGFEKPMADAMEQSVSPSASDISPIMAAIQQIAVDNLTSQQGRSIPTSIFVISDLLENTEFFSIYASGPDYDGFQRSAAANRFATDLAGASVTLWMVRRGTGDRQGPELIEFWQSWIAENNGMFDRAVKLQGVALASAQVRR